MLRLCGSKSAWLEAWLEKTFEKSLHEVDSIALQEISKLVGTLTPEELATLLQQMIKDNLRIMQEQNHATIIMMRELLAKTLAALQKQKEQKQGFDSPWAHQKIKTQRGRDSHIASGLSNFVSKNKT